MPRVSHEAVRMWKKGERLKSEIRARIEIEFRAGI